MAVRKAGGRWRVEFQQSGRRVFRRLPAIATKADAQALETTLRREILERRITGDGEPPLAAAIEAWLRATAAGRKDRKSPRQNARHLAAFVGQRPVSEVGTAARAAVEAWAATGIAPATMNRRLDVLRAAARYAFEQGLMPANLAGRVPRFPEHNRREVYLTAQDVAALAKAAPDKLTASAIMLAAYTGLRASELLALPATPRNAKALHVPHSKTGQPRLVPIHARIRTHLSALPLAISYRDLVGRFWQAREVAGMQHVHWHDLRHTCASLLINAGVDLFTVGRILGHSSPATTARYAHLDTRALERAVRRIR